VCGISFKLGVRSSIMPACEPDERLIPNPYVMKVSAQKIIRLKVPSLEGQCSKKEEKSLVLKFSARKKKQICRQ
jgi:hypothetical protein